MQGTRLAGAKPAISPQRFAAVLCALLTGPALAGPLTVTIDQARNDLGEVRCGLFDSATGWREEERAVRAANAAIANGGAVCDFGDVPPGDYAVAVFHAEQGEPKVVYGFLGQPKQGVGFSNNPSITFGAPGFETALISVGAGPLAVSITLKY